MKLNSFVARYQDNSDRCICRKPHPGLIIPRPGGVMAIINNITMLAIVSTGSALIGELNTALAETHR